MLALPWTLQSLLDLQHFPNMQKMMNLATRSDILVAEQGDKVSADEEDSEELGLPLERCEAAASTSCLLSSVKVSGCNTRPLHHPTIPPSHRRRVCLYWLSGQDLAGLTTAPPQPRRHTHTHGHTNTHTCCIELTCCWSAEDRECVMNGAAVEFGEKHVHCWISVRKYLLTDFSASSEQLGFV